MKKKKTNKPWSKQETKELFDGISIAGLEWFKKKCGKRSTSAIYQKILREYGKGGLTRGAYTLLELRKTTGYSESHIRRAQSALNQKWKRLGPRGVYLITEDQVEEINCWLQHDFWSKAHRLYGCTWCTSSKLPSRALGLCSKCYWKHRRICNRLGLPMSLKEQIILLQKCKGKGVHAKFVKDGLTRLNAGLALREDQLDWLVLQGA